MNVLRHIRSSRERMWTKRTIKTNRLRGMAEEKKKKEKKNKSSAQVFIVYLTVLILYSSWKFSEDADYKYSINGGRTAK